MKTLSVRNLSSEDAFNRFVWVSVAVHAVFFFGFTVKTLLMPSETIRFEDAIRVDVVALPDKLPTADVAAPPQKQNKPAPVAEPAKPEPKKPEAVALKKDVKKAQDDALNKLKQRAALEKLKGEKNDVPEPPKKKNLYVGNQVTQGNSVTGLERISQNEYVAQLKDRIAGNYTLPNFLMNSNLKTSLDVTIDDDGKLIRIEVVKSSGNPTFDGAATAAVQASAPFPPVPERLTRAFSSITIQFNFPDI